MPSRKPSSPVLDTSEDDASPSDALKLAEQAEAEAAEAEAVAAAARARARAIRLRNEAAADKDDVDATAADDAAAEEDETPSTEPADDTDTPEVTDTTGVDAESGAVEAEPLEEAEESGPEAEADAGAGKSSRLPRVRVSRLFWKVLASCLTLIVIAALLGVSGWMIWHHRQAEHRQQLAAEYTAAARQTVVTLMSLDFNHAQEHPRQLDGRVPGGLRGAVEGLRQAGPGRKGGDRGERDRRRRRHHERQQRRRPGRRQHPGHQHHWCQQATASMAGGRRHGSRR